MYWPMGPDYSTFQSKRIPTVCWNPSKDDKSMWGTNHLRMNNNNDEYLASQGDYQESDRATSW